MGPNIKCPLAIESMQDMDAYMATVFGGEARDLCWELGRAKH